VNTMSQNQWVSVGPTRTELRSKVIVASLCLGIMVGTGGELQSDQILSRLGTGSVRDHVSDTSARQRHQGLAAELNAIRHALRLSVAETAQLFGVSRPTIYSWQEGNPIGIANSERLLAIFRAVEPHLQLFSAQVGRVAHRAIEGRTTLLQKMTTAGDVDQAVGQLVSVLKRESAQRERLAGRLRGRSSNRGAADLDALG